ncbi:MAG: DNA polymerase III subunit alpha [Planctomycetaceae bacterium]|nr:DNA polymerase III subunit alpha [Planctomycetaceae bacterium]
MSYGALWCKSNASFLEGASHPEELVEEAHRQGLLSLALVDRDGVGGIVRAHGKAKELGMRLLVGAEVTLAGGGADRGGGGDGAGVDGKNTVVLLARTRDGYANLCQLLSAGRLRSPKGQSAVGFDEVCAFGAGLVALVRDAEHPFGALRDALGKEHVFALLARHRRADEVAAERALVARAAAEGVPLVAGNEVLYHNPRRRPLQDVLTAIRHGTTVQRAGRLLKANGEHRLLGPEALQNLYRDQPAALEHTRRVTDLVGFSMGELRYRYPLESLSPGESEMQRLQRLVEEGARTRYGSSVPPNVREQLQKELSVIEQLEYGGYFLTMHELVTFCRERGILAQGRGSAANSAVCYCLGITAVDPVRMGLLFERFLSLERAEPPDIDLDMEHERREEVIQHVYARYGRERAAMVANVIRYRAKSALRDVGKALGFPETALLRASNLASSWHRLERSSLLEAGFDLDTHLGRRLVELAGEIEDFPRHLSIHPGGFLLGHEPVNTLVPIEPATMEGRTVIQWDKDDVEALGLFKVDLLALGALTHLHRTFDLIQKHRGIELSMATIPADDTETFDEICRGDTVGVFQIESRAQMAMLPRLKPRTYYDLVIEVSIVRPGPITGGMVHPYLRRRNGEEPVLYPHPCLEPVLAKTLGVPLFQEQVMRLAVVAADYTPGEADQLRRDMAAWRKSGRIEHHRERLVSRMQQKGIAVEFAERVFEQIRGFGEYGFPESHAASFALISYAGAYLRRHFRTEFTCGLLNAQPMGFYSVATIVEDAKRHGVRFLPVDVQRSAWDAVLEEGAIRMGLRLVKHLGAADGERIEAARAKAPFVDLVDFQRRARPSAAAGESLAQAGALDSLCAVPEGKAGRARRKALWASLLDLEPKEGVAGLHQGQLFDDEVPAEAAFAPLDGAQVVAWDHLSSGHSVRAHAMAPLRALLAAKGFPDARTLCSQKDGKRVRYAGLVICRQRPGTAGGITFMTLEDETGFVNLIVRPDVYTRQKVLLSTQAFLGVRGRLQKKDGVAHVIAADFFAPELKIVPVEPKTRDFR